MSLKLKTRFIFLDNDGVLTPETASFHLRKINEFGCTLTKEEYEKISMGNWYETDYVKKLNCLNTQEYVNFISSEYAKIQISEETKAMIQRLYYCYHIAMVSSGSEKVIKPYLKNNGIDRYFLDVLGRETHVSKVEKFNVLLNKYKLNPMESLFITDSLGDIHEANEVGIPAIGISWGVHSEEILRQGNPIGIINNFAEIEKFF